MKFEEFINASRSIAIVITVKEYIRIKPLLQRYYNDHDIAHIDDYCRYKWSSEKFLLCNPYERQSISTPMLLQNAVTFINRISFEDVIFPELSEAN